MTAGAAPAGKGKKKPSPPSKPSPRPAAPAASSEPVDDSGFLPRVDKLKQIVKYQSWAIGGLGLVFAMILPFAHPVDYDYAVNPNRQVKLMPALTMPNMTNRAVLSWATTSITEIMTMGFGDIDVKAPKQRWRFTKKGWEAYSKAFIKNKIDATFRQNQLVLTTVPSNTPVIISQGVNIDDVYQWIVQMPVIMTYATNNNVTKRQSGIVTLLITRVPTENNPGGIAIDQWALDAH